MGMLFTKSVRVDFGKVFKISLIDFFMELVVRFLLGVLPAV